MASAAAGKPKPGSHAWALNEEESRPFFRQALDLGINFFDTANVYSAGASEEVLGRFLKANTRREAIVLATKVHGMMRDEPNGGGLSRKAIFYRARPEPAPPADRLCGPLPDSSLGLRNADRRNAGSAARRGESGQGAVHRRVVDVCMAIHARRFISPIVTAGRASFPCRTITTCSIAKKSGR